MTDPWAPGEVLARQRILPVITIDDAANAVPLARALLAGGIACAEVALRTPAALDAIRAMAQVDGFVVGAGTVLTVDDLDAVRDAGALFGVAPGLSLSTARAALAGGFPFLPGVATSSEVMAAVGMGFRVLKLFPADLIGGPAAIAAFRGPFPGVTFVPSGGVGPANVPEYLASDAVAAVSGTWMAQRAAIAAGAFDSIAELARAASGLTPPA